jgi:creatinine amidohydrolase
MSGVSVKPDAQPPIMANLSWQEASDLLQSRPVGLVPVGAVEAHGPHLPLNSDIIIAEATARAAAVRLIAGGIPAAILPTISYSVSFAGTSFPGTSPVDPDAFEAYVRSILTHLAPQGYQAIICCNAHLEPAHFERMQSACRAAEEMTGIPMRTPDQRSERFASLLSEEFRAGARHAGAYETSIILAVAPNVVNTTVMQSLPAVWIDLPARLREGARTFAEAGASLGYFGNPATSSIGEGERLLDALAEIVWTTYQDINVGRVEP